MTFEYIIDKNISKTLTQSEQQTLVDSITQSYIDFDKKRESNLSKAHSVIDEIFFKTKINYPTSDKKQNWKAKVKMCKLFMFYQTLKAFIWRNIYANVNSMFDVSGENQDSDNASNKQKAMLVDILEKMEFSKTCDNVIDNALLYGELISFTAWKKKTQEYRRPIDFFRNLFSSNPEKLPLILEAIAKRKNYWIDEKLIYDNPYIYPVNPENFVFDISQKENWDACPKIYRSFKSLQDIINNKLFKLSKSDIKELKALVETDNNLSPDYKKQLNEITNGQTIEILEFWGDLKLPSGSILTNWNAVIIARKYLVRFKKNETIINPFTYGAFIQDPSSKRGISPLFSILEIAHTQEDFFNRTLNLQALSENPPLLAPEGFFTQSEINIYPGKIIEYGDNISPTSAFKQLTVENRVFLDDINYLDNLMSEVSGIYPSMVGTDEDYTKTATEINTKTQGQLTRLSMMLDIINQDFIIPTIKNIAKLCADFKSGVEMIYINKNNQKDTILIDDSIRQAEYKYTYSDRTMIADKSQKADLLIQAVEKFVANGLTLNLDEIFVWYFEQKGVENPERFLSQKTVDASSVQPTPLVATPSSSTATVSSDGEG